MTLTLLSSRGGGFKLPTSKDPIIHDMTWTELKDDAVYHYKSTRVENQQDFLNKVPAERTRNRYKSQWTRARIASDHLKIKWRITENKEVETDAGEDTISKRNTVFHKLRNFQRKKRTTSLRDLHPQKAKKMFVMPRSKKALIFIKM